MDNYGTAVITTGQDETFEDKGGRRREYLDANGALDSALGVKPWETSPVDVNSETPPDWLLNNPFQCECWRKAWALRCELEHE
jgi:hypothetical protein